MIENERQIITQLFEVAFKEKNAYDIEYAMLIAFTFNLFIKNFVNILCYLIRGKMALSV